LLLAVLSAVMLFAWHPWQDNTLPPALTISPRTGVGLGDGVVVDGARRPTTADARVASAERGAAASRPVALAERQVPELGISGARPASRAASPATPEGPPQNPSPAPAPVPVPMPVSTPAPAPAPAPIPSPQPVDAVEEAPAPPDRSTAVVKVPVRVENATVQICDSHEYVLTFSVFLEGMVFAPAGSENSVVRVVGGETVVAESFLGAVSEASWHEIEVDFAASSDPEGFYAIYLDGEPIELAAGVGLIPSGSVCAPMEVGLFRDGQPVQESSEFRIAGLEFSDAQDSAVP
jgi:hypothetical protein